MPTQAQVQSVRKAALRELRRRQRECDSQIERMERRIFTLLDRKSLITAESIVSLAEQWNKFVQLSRRVEQGLIDLITIVNQ